MVHFEMEVINNLSDRREIEDVLNVEAHQYLDLKKDNKKFSSVFLGKLPMLESSLSLWLSLTDIRNDIDHAGMRESPKKPTNLIKHIQKDVDTLNKLPLPERI
jgi:hypothetical protein